MVNKSEKVSVLTAPVFCRQRTQKTVKQQWQTYFEVKALSSKDKDGNKTE